MKLTPMTLTTALTLILGTALATPALAGEGRARVPLGDSQFRGAKQATVTVLEFVDYECPYCRKAEQTMRTLLQRYPKDVRLQIVHSPLDFHAHASLASAAVVAAGNQGKQWPMHDRLMAAKNVEKATIDHVAAELGLDLSRFAKDLESAQATLKQDAERAKTAGVRGTPAFLINGRLVTGAQPIEAFQRVIDEEVQIANALLKQGTKREKLYDEIISHSDADKEEEPVECKHEGEGC